MRFFKKAWNFIKEKFKKREEVIIDEIIENKTPYDWALTQLGVKEIRGSKHNPKIQEYLSTVKLNNYSDETAWCAAFVNWCCIKAGVKGSNKANARSFLNVGRKVNKPQRGDIVVLWRESRDSWKGHVGFFNRFNSNGDIVLLGGNQSNSVSFKTYPKERTLQFRRV